MSVFPRSFYSLVFSLLFSVTISFAQNDTLVKQPDYLFAAVEYSIGKTSKANVDFPELRPQNGLLFSIGTTNNNPQIEWARQLNYPETGLTFSYVDMGNSAQLGQTISLIPFIDFKVFSGWTNRMNCKIGLGASYFNTIYDEVDNPNNKAISTSFTWAFRSNLYYSMFQNQDYNFKLGIGYFHNSNGHLRLPNQGLNTFLLSAYSQFNWKKSEPSIESSESQIPNSRQTQRYFSSRVGLGQKVLSKYSTEKKEVYAFAVSTGKVINKTFKYGYGMYYRFYEDYYDYIKDDEKLVRELYPEFRDKPVLYASNFGLFASGELLLSHVGIEFELGLNLYKPAYKIDWQINEEKYVEGVYQLGELNWYYQLKKTVSSRLGAKWYAISTNKSPRHNIFLGAYINANFGQADFTELTLGYVYALN